MYRLIFNCKKKNIVYQQVGGMSEWSNEHAWKACIPRGIMGSNPIPSTIFLKENQRRIIFFEVSAGDA